MPNVRMENISINDPAWLYDTYCHDMTCTSIGIRTTISEFFEEQVCLVILVCIEESNRLKYRMKQIVCKASVTHLDQK